MKVIHLLGTLVLTLVFSVGFSSCEKEAQILPDPEGTVTINMINGGGTEVMLFQQAINSSYYGYIWIDEDNNFCGNGYLSIEFSTLGNFNCFASAVQKAMDFIQQYQENYGDFIEGWSSRVAVIPGNAYWVRLNCFDYYDYSLIYVQDYLTNTSNGVMGAIVKYLN